MDFKLVEAETPLQIHLCFFSHSIKQRVLQLSTVTGGATPSIFSLDLVFVFISSSECNWLHNFVEFYQYLRPFHLVQFVIC